MSTHDIDAFAALKERRITVVATEIEKKFDQMMLKIYDRAAKECSYRPIRFLQIVHEPGGVAAAKELLHGPRPAEGLTKLWELGRLDLSMEALVCGEPWRTLFTDEEVATAEKRLRELGYAVGQLETWTSS